MAIMSDVGGAPRYPREQQPAAQPTPAATGGGTSGWEVADKAAHGVGTALDGIGWFLTKGYGVLLIIAGIVLLVMGGWDAKGILACLVVSAYGVYLLVPGDKFVIW